LAVVAGMKKPNDHAETTKIKYFSLWMYENLAGL